MPRLGTKCANAVQIDSKMTDRPILHFTTGYCRGIARCYFADLRVKSYNVCDLNTSKNAKPTCFTWRGRQMCRYILRNCLPMLGGMLLLIATVAFAQAPPQPP